MVNEDGQLGLGHNNHINIPTLLMNDKIIKILFSGGYHKVMLLILTILIIYKIINIINSVILEENNGDVSGFK